MGSYSEQIVYTSSEDHLGLAGVVMQPTEGAVRPIAMVMLHGGSVGFYYPPMYVYLGRALAERGYRYVSGNTRSHDVASANPPWPPTCREADDVKWRLGGEGWSRFDEEPYDVAGWIDFFTAQGAEQIVLFGHSGGVRKVLYYQAERQDPRVVGVILAGTSDRGFTAIDPDRLELAERMVADGQEDALLPVPEGVPMVFGMYSAASYVTWGRYVRQFAAEGDTPWLASIRVPVLGILGAAELEGSPLLRPNYENMRSRAVHAPRFDIQVIEGADHCYTGREQALAEVVLGWLESLP